MPSQTESFIAPFPDDVPTADISSVDFSKLVDGDKDEAQKVFDAARGYGFFYLTNTRIDSDFMFDLAHETFSLSLEEKMQFEMGSTGRYFGYKMSGSTIVDAKGTADCSEFYNVSKDDILRVGPYQDNPLSHPSTVDKRRNELETFMTSAHSVILTILRVLNDQLDLKPGTLETLHQISSTGGDQARLTHAPPVPSTTITLGEHTDFGSVTVLFNQLGGLQVMNPDSREWRYVVPRSGAAIINLGDALVKLVGGRLYSGLHRVVGPPGEQAKSVRHSVVYFARPNGDVRLRSLFAGDEIDGEGEEVLTADEWIAQRAKLRNKANFKGAKTFDASRGTEHHVKGLDRKPALDKPAATVEVL